MLIVNGTTIENVVCNGQDLDKLIYNDVVVFEKSGFNAEQVLIDFDYIRNSDGTYTITDWKGTYQGQESTECIVPNKKEIRLYSKTIVASSIKDSYIIGDGKSIFIDFDMYGFTDRELQELIIESNFSYDNIVKYNNFNIEKKNTNYSILRVELQGVSTEEITITSMITVKLGKHICSKRFLLQNMAFFYTISNVSGYSYTFNLNAAGYYESNNKNRHGTGAMCKVNIFNPLKKNIYIDYIQTSENGYDYGIIYALNSTSTIHTSLQYVNAETEKSILYGNYIEGDIYILYRKDNSTSSGNDSLQFKVRVE